ncbi:MAG: hypothetical protein DRO23_02280 [Thermoprotei archaeon]|nr:MAG: hypothetical protein DRO23_02280 [Thermoprotei archaeon]
MSDIDPSFLKYINSQRVKMLKYIVWGVNSIDELSHVMLTGKNVVKRHARLLETIGVLNIKSNTLELNKAPRNIALLYCIGIIDEKGFFKMVRDYILSIIEQCSRRVNVENINIYFSGDGGLLIETASKIDESIKSKIAERILKKLKFTYVHFK